MKQQGQWLPPPGSAHLKTATNRGQSSVGRPGAGTQGVSHIERTNVVCLTRNNLRHPIVDNAISRFVFLLGNFRSETLV